MNKSFKQLIQFGMIGVVNTILNFLIYQIFIHFCHFSLSFWIFTIHDYMVGYTIAFIITVASAYYLQNRFVFESKEQKHSTKIFKTYTAYFITFLITQVCLWLIIDVIARPQVINVADFAIYIKTWAIIPPIFITIPTNFLVHKFWVYREGVARADSSD